MPSTTALRIILRTPPTLRPLLRSYKAAYYHSYEHPDPPPYNETEFRILSAALQHVPTHGFTKEALTLGAKNTGYLDISTNLFTRSGGAFDLVLYHLVTQRLALKNRVQFAPEEKLGMGRKVKSLILSRLHANTENPKILPRWQEALAIMSLRENIPASLKELGLLSDEIWFLAGDKSVDSSWYTKRATLGGVYASTEIFMTTDLSTDYRDTEEFLGRRLEEVRVLGSAVGGTVEWVGFQMGGLMDLVRSKGVRI